MPPFVPRKREHSPERLPHATRPSTKALTKQAKSSLFDLADTPNGQFKSSEETKKFLDSLDDDEESSLSDVESDEFEDVPSAKKRKTVAVSSEKSVEDEEDEMDWEDAMGKDHASASMSTPRPDPEIEDVSIVLKDDGSYVERDIQERMLNGQKGPTKRERRIRILTHCLHVQSLLWHNTVRNSWLNDKEVQKTLVAAVPDGVKREITRWREAMGTLTKEELEAKKKKAAAKNKGKYGRKSKGKGRDWNYEAQHSEQGVPNLSGGDPLLRLLKVLTAYWRKRFAVTAPAFRKRGYMPLKRLRQHIKDWEKDHNDFEEHGERIENIKAFRKSAKECEGSRDVGGQLFVALLRGIGVETRMVVNLQPAGIGWSKAEEADGRKPRKEVAEVEALESESELELTKQPKGKNTSKSLPKAKAEQASRKSARGNKADPISLEDSDSPLSEPPDNDEETCESDEDKGDDDVSVVDVTPNIPKKQPTKKYDRDLAFPTYWAEVCSPATHKYTPVDPIVLSTIASNDELLQTFEPRGNKAEKAKQVICYVTAFSADGSGKDVTVRYLKKHQLPGKTKGVRMPAEKLPIYNKRGKVKKYEEYDWFRTVMSLYDKPDTKRTAADDLEDQVDLKPFKPAKQDNNVEKESLQWYKQSSEYVLEQHLRREEALVPGAEPVKLFKAGKGENAKEHDVYLRRDVVTCKTVESWHKEGRAIKTGEQPVKHVPMRAVTIIKKREIEEAERETGEKMKQGLYARDQTDWIIPPPIKNGVIPKNAYGNMDVYVETMVPKGAVHLKLKGSAKICRKLEIDYAEACTGFEFGKQRAVPVLTGVVVAQENANVVRDAWHVEQQEIKRKEDTKRTAIALHWWRKLLMGMRIVERMRAEYDHSNEEDINPFVSKTNREDKERKLWGDEGGGGGGFLPPGHDEGEYTQHVDGLGQDEALGGGFLADSDAESDLGDLNDGGVLIEDNPDLDNSISNSTLHTPVTPVSFQSMHKTSGTEDNDDNIDATLSGFSPNAAVRPLLKKSIGHSAKSSSKAKASQKFKSRAPDSKRGEQHSVPCDSAEVNKRDDESIQSGSRTNMAAKSERRSSPKVIVSPQVNTAPSERRTRSARAAKKATPTRSRYFIADEEDENEMASEQEVVKPTRTTARTRKSG